MAVVSPSYETPYMPTLPLLLATFFTSQSMLSYASVVSSVDFGLDKSRGGAKILNVPSDLNRPRRFWNTKMYPSCISSLNDGGIVVSVATPLPGTPYGVRVERIGNGPF